jgi:hypothetical protein
MSTKTKPRRPFVSALDTLRVMTNTHVGMSQSTTPFPSEQLLFSFNRWREAYRRALKAATTMEEVEEILIWIGCPTIGLMRKSLRKMMYLAQPHPYKVRARLKTLGHFWVDHYLK